YVTADGREVELDANLREQLGKNIAAASDQAMRTLAFAHLELEPDFPTDESEIRNRRADLDAALVLTGFVAIRDPLRNDVSAAIRQCREAGIDVKVITGDNFETARAIGREIGLLDNPDSLAMTSEEFNRLSDEELKLLLPRLHILARAKPLDKYRL